MNKQVYHAIKSIVTLARVDYDSLPKLTQERFEKNIDLVLSWIDEVSKEFEKTCSSCGEKVVYDFEQHKYIKESEEK